MAGGTGIKGLRARKGIALGLRQRRRQRQGRQGKRQQRNGSHCFSPRESKRDSKARDAGRRWLRQLRGGAVSGGVDQPTGIAASAGHTFELAEAIVETDSFDGSSAKMHTAAHCVAAIAPLPQSWQWDPDAGLDIALDKDAACIPSKRAKIVNKRNSRAGIRCRMNEVWVAAAAVATFLTISSDHTAESLAVDGGYGA